MSCISPYKPPVTFEGRFFQWIPVNYYLEDQFDPIEFCAPSTDSCIYEFPDETESYPIPVQHADVVKWIMDKSEMDVDSGTLVSDLVIAIVKQGVLIADMVGTVSQVDGSDQYYCTATIPCLPDACDYQFVIYDKTQGTPIDCTLFHCSVLQDLINSNLLLGDVLNCVPILDWGC